MSSAYSELLGPARSHTLLKRYESTVISQSLPGLALSRSSITALLKNLGQHRPVSSLFVKDFLYEAEVKYIIPLRRNNKLM